MRRPRRNLHGKRAALLVAFVILFLLGRLCEASVTHAAESVEMPPKAIIPFVGAPVSTIALDSLVGALNEEYERRRRKRFIDSVFQSMNGYVTAISYLESRHNYGAVNQYGYMGRYQFGRRTLIGLGYSQDEVEEFINCPDMQDEAMVKLIIHNQQVLRNYRLFKYIDKDVGGVRITMEGLLAGAHLVGPYAVKKFLDSGGVDEAVDGNNTSVKKYLSYFSNERKLILPDSGRVSSTVV